MSSRCAALHQQPDHRLMSRSSRLMQRGGMRMPAWRVITVRIFARIQQHPHNFDMTVIRRQAERQMSVQRTRQRKQLARVFDSSQSCRNGQINLGSAFEQSMQCFKLRV